ncbi:MAG: peroxiredoxin-like family protein [Bacteroidota bacterium]
MKKLLFLFLFVTGISSAQIAKNPEDISPLLIGEKIPNIELKDSLGTKINTKDIFKNKKTVLIVYRGGWCPFCNSQLADMQAIQKDIETLGYQIVAVSPDAFSKIEKTSEKGHLSYQLYSDVKNEFSQALGIAFEAPLLYSPILKKNSGGENSGVIPVPTVYVINEDNKIEFLFINPDYKQRLKGDLLLAVLKNL